MIGVCVDDGRNVAAGRAGFLEEQPLCHNDVVDDAHSAMRIGKTESLAVRRGQDNRIVVEVVVFPLPARQEAELEIAPDDIVHRGDVNTVEKCHGRIVVVVFESASSILGRVRSRHIHVVCFYPCVVAVLVTVHRCAGNEGECVIQGQQILFRGVDAVLILGEPHMVDVHPDY